MKHANWAGFALQTGDERLEVAEGFGICSFCEPGTMDEPNNQAGEYKLGLTGLYFCQMHMGELIADGDEEWYDPLGNPARG